MVVIFLPQICTGEGEMINYIILYYKRRGKTSVYPKSIFFFNIRGAQHFPHLFVHTTQFVTRSVTIMAFL